MRKLVHSIILLLLSNLPATASAETATVVTDTSLYQTPSIQAVKLQKIVAGTPVYLVRQVGSWKQISVKADNSSGWVRSYQVRSGDIRVTTEKQESGGFFGTLANLSRKASGLFSSERKGYSYQRTATIGVRGLSEEQIKNAQADYAELEKLESFRSSKKLSKQFSLNGQLQARKVKHMPKSSKEK